MRIQAIQKFFKLAILFHVKQSLSILPPLAPLTQTLNNVGGLDPTALGIDLPLSQIQLNNLRHGVQFVGLANAQDDGAQYKVYPDDIKSDEEFQKERLGLKQHIERPDIVEEEQSASDESGYFGNSEEDSDEEQVEDSESDEDEDDEENRKRREVSTADAGTKKKKKKNSKGKLGKDKEDKSKSVDLTKDPCFPGIYDQKTCASCYGWAVFLVAKYLMCKNYGKNVTMSVQEVVDCSNFQKNPKYGNFGCGGGHMVDVAQYYQSSTSGWTSDDSYPYVSKETECKIDGKEDSKLDHILKPGEFNITYVGWPKSPYKEEDIIKLLDEGKPCVISMYSNDYFRHYSKGVLGSKKDEPCECPKNVNHAVTF